MIVRAKKGISDEIGIQQSVPYIVVCIYTDNNGNGKQYFIFNEEEMAIPYLRPAELFDYIDDEEPSSWCELSHEGVTIKSFQEWTNDPKFYNYLLEDSWQPEKTRWASRLVYDKYTEYIESYAARVYGSVYAAKKHILQKEHDYKVQQATEKGYEQPGDFNPDVSEVNAVHLSLNILTRSILA